ncbi:MAG: succinyl-diaminopimelate desuccinylase [Campylobacteraceae bacterium]|jgi:succinyl-diaminopimelate desuccinylase|nr:succinyl-diaminopimelate desuccinylase [Campylobacteraceae bacterium]
MEDKELFFALLNTPSITPQDGGLLAFIEDYLPDFTAKRVDIDGIKNLFLYKKFGEGIHLCFAGHVDVVPPGEGWDHDPFEPLEKDGFIYARGAQDMKSGICAILQACKGVKHFNGTLSILLTSDEEGEAKNGTAKVLEFLKSQDFLPTFAIVAEPTCVRNFGDTIKIGRRGSINGKIEIKGVQGHVAYPQNVKNPIHQTVFVLPKIAEHKFDDGDDIFEPSMLIITDIKAGEGVTNITPKTLTLMFNVRNSPLTKIENVERYLRSSFGLLYMVNNPGKDKLDFDLELKEAAKPYMTDKSSILIAYLERSIEEVTGLVPEISAGGGTSDARFFAEFGVSVAEFGVLNDTIHAANERCHISHLYDLIKVFKTLLTKF